MKKAAQLIIFSLSQFPAKIPDPMTTVNRVLGQASGTMTNNPVSALVFSAKMHYNCNNNKNFKPKGTDR